MNLASHEKVVMAPVPITLIKRNGTFVTKLPKTIGFVGRIQPERGLEFFYDFAKMIFNIDPTIKFLIVGDGSSRKSFEELLEKSIPKNQIEFMGHLPLEELEKVWERIGVLVSTAPSESYGRALREALIHGVPVWSTDTRGLRDLIQEYPPGKIRKISLNNSEAKFNEDLTFLFSQERDFGYRHQYEIARASIVGEIGSFWARLL
jgi:glycosyltransferase involved in cell wall biosynthesis